MSIVKWYPATTRFESLYDTLFDDVLQGFDHSRQFLSAGNSECGELTPKIEVVEKKDSYVLRAELPGVKKEDVDISVSHGVLKITGELKSAEEEGSECYCSERAYGKFQRTLQIPSTVDVDFIEAKHKDGILELCMPKTKEAIVEEKKIKIA
ncbi:MAG: Hsp20/alpha crystallin family protein [Nitrospirae bacterium]|nr:Hsp20/alpha crystallin family protein [Nitrospirota bacterium]MBF0534178.1 Hsp20/alpha crystallin family protein [Nitrospirota bacterium]MBF0617065.1 Hsp20/alpha crystallin family protein [Nitrospirota bacterium]